MQYLGTLARYALSGALVTFMYVFFVTLGLAILSVGYAAIGGAFASVRAKRDGRRVEREIFERQREYFDKLSKAEPPRHDDDPREEPGE